MLQWIIEYWDDLAKNVVCFDCTTVKWYKLPVDNVLYVYIKFLGQVGFGKPERTYQIRVAGYDYFYLKKFPSDGSVKFGGWNDDPLRPGSMFIWTPNAWVVRESIVGRPDFLNANEIKLGVWVDEPWASMLGFTSLDGLRTITGCCE